MEIPVEKPGYIPQKLGVRVWDFEMSIPAGLNPAGAGMGWHMHGYPKTGTRTRGY